MAAVPEQKVKEAWEADVMREGDTVILEHRLNPHQVEVKFAMLKKGSSAKVARGNVPHEELLGFPFGTKFTINKHGKPAISAVEEGVDRYQELIEASAMGGEDEEGGEKPSGETRDNRTLVDRNATSRGKECSQKLGSTEIQNLKSAGMSGHDVIKELISNSETFKQKTEYSQAKWLRKKAAKHAPQFACESATAFSLCRAYFHKEPAKTCYLREDAMARMLTLSNVQPGSRALVVDSSNGMMLGAVAERVGGTGTIAAGYNGIQPSVDAVRWLNLADEVLQPLFHFPLSEIGAMSAPSPAPAPAATPAAPSAPAVDAAAAAPADVVAVAPVVEAAAAAVEDAGGKVAEGGGDAMEGVEGAGAEAAAAAKAAPGGEGAPAGGEGEVAVVKEVDPLAVRRKRVEMGQRVGLSFRPGAIHNQRKASLEEVQEELGKGFDSLVVCGSLCPKALVPRLLPLLKLSAPFVVFSPSPQPLFALQEILIKEEMAMAVNMSETWMREYQVLPGRTHPTMQMSGASGYILQGIRVDKKGRRPPPIPTPVKAPREPAVKKETAPTEAAPTSADAGGKAAETETPAAEESEQKGEKRGHDAEEGGEEPSAKKAKVEE